MPLEINITKKEEGVFIVDIFGSIDSMTYMDLEKKVEPILVSSTKRLLFNMEGVDYISSMGVSVILKTKKAMEKHGGTLVVINLKPQIKAVFETIRALPSICVFESLEEVDNYLDAIQRKEIEKHKGN